MSSATRLIVIGVGRWGQELARTTARLEGTSLEGVFDADAALAERTAQALGVRAYRSLEEVLEVRPDGVVVATPDNAHREPVVALLQAGIHVLVEKPIATTEADAQAITDAASVTRGSLSVGHILRFDPRYIAVRDAVAFGRLGDVVHVLATRENLKEHGLRRADTTTVEAFLGIHDVDAIQWITGQRVTQVFAVGSRRVYAAHERNDTTVATVRLDGGAVGSITSSWALPNRSGSMIDASLQVVGTRGSAQIDMRQFGLRITTEEAGDAFPNPAGVDVYGLASGALADELTHFARVTRGEALPMATASEAFDALKVVLAMERSLTAAAVVDIALGRDGSS